MNGLPTSIASSARSSSPVKNASPNTLSPRFFDTRIGGRHANGFDGLLAAIEDKRIEVSLHPAAKAQASFHFRHHPREGNPNLGVTNTSDTRGEKHKDKGPTANKGKAGIRPDKPKPRPHPKAEVKHETQG
jgi:hypothetical protein